MKRALGTGEEAERRAETRASLSFSGLHSTSCFLTPREPGTVGLVNPRPCSVAFLWSSPESDTSRYITDERGAPWLLRDGAVSSFTLWGWLRRFQLMSWSRRDKGKPAPLLIQRLLSGVSSLHICSGGGERKFMMVEGRLWWVRGS